MKGNYCITMCLYILMPYVSEVPKLRYCIETFETVPAALVGSHLVPRAEVYDAAGQKTEVTSVQQVWESSAADG